MSPPARQGCRFGALCQVHRERQCPIKIGFNCLARDFASQEIGPAEFAERRFVFRIPAGSFDCASQRAKWVVDEIFYRQWKFAVGAPFALDVERMSPVPAFERRPEFVEFERVHICNNRDRIFRHAFIMQRTCEVMAINDVVTNIGADDHRNAMTPPIGGGVITMLLAPTGTLESNLPHPHRGLGGRKIRN